MFQSAARDLRRCGRRVKRLCAANISEETILGDGWMIWVGGLLLFALVFVGGGLIVLAATTKTTALIVLTAVVVGIAILALVLVQAALQGIYSAALYRYAAEGEAGGAFAHDMVADAFRVKA